MFEEQYLYTGPLESHHSPDLLLRSAVVYDGVLQSHLKHFHALPLSLNLCERWPKGELKGSFPLPLLETVLIVTDTL